nr:MAG TPA: nitrile hydratase a chain [Caudoviricetes sp.]
MSANKFKVGDKVKVRKGLVAGEFYDKVRCHSRIPKMCGEVLTVRYVRGDYYKLEENTFAWSDQMLELVEKTLDNLCAGDFVKSGGKMKKVLVAIDGCYLLSRFGEYSKAADWYTAADLKGYGYILMGSDDPEPTIEINGKKYIKTDFERAIKNLEPID